jgi:hypothetical protein
MAERRKRIYPPSKHTTGISFEKDQYALLELAAKGADRPVAYVVRQACAYWLESSEARKLLRQGKEKATSASASETGTPAASPETQTGAQSPAPPAARPATEAS